MKVNAHILNVNCSIFIIGQVFKMYALYRVYHKDLSYCINFCSVEYNIIVSFFSILGI